jgi:rRNA maturation endonuclease Nob1
MRRAAPSRPFEPQVEATRCIHLPVERPNNDERQLVRCLDCGTVYPLPLRQEAAGPCPQCGGVPWVALAALKMTDDESGS